MRGGARDRQKIQERRFVPGEIKVSEGVDFHVRKCCQSGWKSTKWQHNSAVRVEYDSRSIFQLKYNIMQSIRQLLGGTMRSGVRSKVNI